MIKTPNLLRVSLFLITSIFGMLIFSVHAALSPDKVEDHYINIQDDVRLFYQDSGRGQTLILIPGWTMSSEIFKAQIAHFSKKYRVIALDPRSQGHSSITLENNTYTQHGSDLARFIEILGLKKVVLVAWSWGCYDAYAYIRLKGVDNLKAFVCIDAPPKSSGNKKEWAALDYQDWGAAVIQPMMYHRVQFAHSWAQSMVDHKLRPEEQDWIVRESFHTPTYAALELNLDAIYADYRPEAKLLDINQVPTLDFVAEHWASAAKKWLHVNAPHANVKVISKHLMFWEHPDEFNQALDEFLDKVV